MEGGGGEGGVCGGHEKFQAFINGSENISENFDGPRNIFLSFPLVIVIF